MSQKNHAPVASARNQSGVHRRITPAVRKHFQIHAPVGLSPVPDSDGALPSNFDHLVAGCCQQAGLSGKGQISNQDIICDGIPSRWPVSGSNLDDTIGSAVREHPTASGDRPFNGDAGL